MAKIKGSIVVDNERCKGCGVCVASCPCDVLALSSEVNGKGYPVVRMAHPEACTGVRFVRRDLSRQLHYGLPSKIE